MASAPATVPAHTSAPARIPAPAAAPDDAARSDAPAVSFADLGLPAVLVSALARRGITSPFPVQVAAIPDALAGRDVLGRGRTGSGKTLGFGLPMLARLAGGRRVPNRPRGLVLVPTRELAAQVSDALAPLAAVSGMRSRVVVGGQSMGAQINALRRGVDIVVATPGRLTDLVERGACVLDQVQITVLDEADHMCDLGFLPPVTALLELVPGDGQRMLFSATLDKRVDVLVKRFLNDPVSHSVDPPSNAGSEMDHFLFGVEMGSKVAVAAQLARTNDRTLIFVRTRRGADRLARDLSHLGIDAGALHGDLGQGARTRALAAFSSGKRPVLVATDVAARGIHVDGVDLVLHFDPPTEPDAYLHRSGRTARAGASGVVITLVLDDQLRAVRQLLRTAGVAVPTTQVVPATVAAALVESKPDRAQRAQEEEARAASAPAGARRGRPARGAGGRPGAGRGARPTGRRTGGGPRDYSSRTPRSERAGAPGYRSERPAGQGGRSDRQGGSRERYSSSTPDRSARRPEGGRNGHRAA